MRTDLADHWVEMLGPEVGQVNEGKELGDMSKPQLPAGFVRFGAQSGNRRSHADTR